MVVGVPAEWIHLTALREAAFLGSLATPARRCVLRFESAARLGAIGPDLPYFDHYGEELVRYVAGIPARASSWGARVHSGGAIELLGSVLDRARRERSELLAALAMGLASHASIDRSMHPLVNALARRFPEGRSHDASHREVEKFQSILFHERYYGRDHLGSAAIGPLIGVPAAELIATTLAGPALAQAYGRMSSESRFEKPLRRMANGYGMHRAVLSSPLGKRVASAAEKERARPIFFEGGWGNFERVLEQTVRFSVPVIEAVWAAFEATDRDATSARAALAALLPEGSIEGQGHDVDVARPFVTRPPREIAA
jgi:hypothetical protein